MKNSLWPLKVMAFGYACRGFIASLFFQGAICLSTAFMFREWGWAGVAFIVFIASLGAGAAMFVTRFLFLKQQVDELADLFTARMRRVIEQSAPPGMRRMMTPEDVSAAYMEKIRDSAASQHAKNTGTESPWRKCAGCGHGHFLHGPAECTYATTSGFCGCSRFVESEVKQ